MSAFTTFYNTRTVTFFPSPPPLDRARPRLVPAFAGRARRAQKRRAAAAAHWHRTRVTPHRDARAHHVGRGDGDEDGDQARDDQRRETRAPRTRAQEDRTRGQDAPLSPRERELGGFKKRVDGSGADQGAGSAQDESKEPGVRPFEHGGETSLEFFAKKAGRAFGVSWRAAKETTALFDVGTVFEYHLFDCVEMLVRNYKGMREFGNAGTAAVAGSKPCLCFQGEDLRRTTGCDWRRTYCATCFEGGSWIGLISKGSIAPSCARR